MIEQLYDYAHDTQNPEKNFDLGYEYEKMGQTASAFSFYLRAAERTDNMVLRYEALIRAALCIDRQKRRNFSTEGLLQYAVSVLPERVEAYFFLAKLYNNNMEHYWRHRSANMIIKLGMDKEQSTDFRVESGYPGQYAMIYERAVSNWQMSLFEKARNDLYMLHKRYEMNAEYKVLVKERLEEYGYPESIKYDETTREYFRYNFEGIEKVKKNHSKHMQDMFVLAAHNGKRKGTYVEFGAGYFDIDSNTYLLEKEFDWKGISFDINRDYCNGFFANRKNTIMKMDVLQVDFHWLFETTCLPPVIDYLQIDCDGASYEILRRIPFDSYKFAVIHFEHDVYHMDPLIREYQRNILKGQGYELVVPDVGIDENRSYEDWWIHPELVDKEVLTKLKSDKEFNFIGDYMFDYGTKREKPIKKLLGSMVPNVLSLEECEDRRKILKRAFAMHGADQVNFNLFKKLDQSDFKIEREHEGLNCGFDGIFSSHLHTIKNWYDNTDDEYGIFFEDDVCLGPLQYWKDFDIEDFISRLPEDCEAVQVCGIYHIIDKIRHDTKFRQRQSLDHGLQAYILKRSYAKKILQSAFRSEDTNVLYLEDCFRDYGFAVTVENAVLSHKYGKVYTFPLFNHNVMDFNSNNELLYVLDPIGMKYNQAILALWSYDYILNWWKNTGSKLTLDEIMEL